MVIPPTGREMSQTYDPALVALSALLACLGAFLGLRAASSLSKFAGVQYKAVLSVAAITIGGGIWSMHFVGMLALRLSIPISYDVLWTLVSALVAILVTGVGLFFVGVGRLTPQRLGAAALFMGSGIAAMHYIGMAAVRANCVISYDMRLVALSVLIGIASSALALWLAFKRRGPIQTAVGAVVLGAAISGMHYTGMAAASFELVETLESAITPAISAGILAIIVAIATFLIFAFTLLTLMPSRGQRIPESGRAGPAPVPRPAAANDVDGPAAPAYLQKLPVEQHQQTVFLDVDDAVRIKADAHYTTAYTETDSFLCNKKVSELEKVLDPAKFLRVHRSHIINIDRVTALQRVKDHGLVKLAGPESLDVPVSRAKLPILRSALGL